MKLFPRLLLMLLAIAPLSACAAPPNALVEGDDLARRRASRCVERTVDMLQQGAGLLNVSGAVTLAKALRTDIAQGTPGIWHNPDILHATAVTLGLGLCVAVAGMAKNQSEMGRRKQRAGRKLFQRDQVVIVMHKDFVQLRQHRSTLRLQVDAQTQIDELIVHQMTIVGMNQPLQACLHRFISWSVVDVAPVQRDEVLQVRSPLFGHDRDTSRSIQH